MSGPNPPEPGDGTAEPGAGQSAPEESRGDAGELVEAEQTAETGPYTHSRAYSAPELEQFNSGPYIPVDPHLYDYDNYEAPDEPGTGDTEPRPPRWPWVVGVTVIVAAVALVVSVALLFVRTETDSLATPATPVTTTSLPPVQDEIITTTPPPPPPPPPSEEPPPPPPEPETTAPPVEAPPETTTQPPETTTTTTTATTTAAPAAPRQITYSVTGTKAPFDQITITYIGPSGQRQTLRNAYIPWSLTLTPISRSEVGSVEASSMLRLSRLNCSITANDGTVLFSNANDGPQASCG